MELKQEKEQEQEQRQEGNNNLVEVIQRIKADIYKEKQLDLILNVDILQYDEDDLIQYSNQVLEYNGYLTLIKEYFTFKSDLLLALDFLNEYFKFYTDNYSTYAFNVPKSIPFTSGKDFHELLDELKDYKTTGTGLLLVVSFDRQPRLEIIQFLYYNPTLLLKQKEEEEEEKEKESIEQTPKRKHWNFSKRTVMYDAKGNIIKISYTPLLMLTWESYYGTYLEYEILKLKSCHFMKDRNDQTDIPDYTTICQKEHELLLRKESLVKLIKYEYYTSQFDDFEYYIKELTEYIKFEQYEPLLIAHAQMNQIRLQKQKEDREFNELFANISILDKSTPHL